jgi:hypothetical protein
MSTTRAGAEAAEIAAPHSRTALLDRRKVVFRASGIDVSDM